MSIRAASARTPDPPGVMRPGSHCKKGTGRTKSSLPCGCRVTVAVTRVLSVRVSARSLLRKGTLLCHVQRSPALTA